MTRVPRLSVVLVLLATLALLPACSDQAPGSYTVEFTFADGPPADEGGLYVQVRVEDRDTPTVAV